MKILLKSKKANPPVTSQQRKHFHKKSKVPTNPVKVATAALVGEWHHRAPHLFTTPVLDLNNKIFSCEGNPDLHTFLPLGTSVHTC